jgi:hypothetical protein
MPPEKFTPAPPPKTFSAAIHDQHQNVVTLSGIAGTSKLSALRGFCCLDAEATARLNEADQWTIVLRSS